MTLAVIGVSIDATYVLVQLGCLQIVNIQISQQRSLLYSDIIYSSQ